MIVISVEKYLPFWNELDESMKKLLDGAVKEIHIEKGTVISDGQTKCTGLIIVIKGQLRAYLMSEEGREITLYRLKNSDMCLFTASSPHMPLVMPEGYSAAWWRGGTAMS